MLMSKSRLEKFLYALYSLDSSDLPNPLSRIEELYRCLVTGEEPPTFEPLSRVEKYLMAILGVYDVNELPNPLSRVEILLHKLAIGDDNLDDIESFLSEHEELLAEIIRNGGVGGNIDIEYVLYTLSTEFNTLYNTAEKPIKSAILKGSTKYRDIDTGDILDTFDETKNLELVSVKMPVLTTTGKNLYPYGGDSTINNPKTSCWYYTNGKEASFGSSCKRTDGGNWFYLEEGVYSFKSINENTITNIFLVSEGEKQYGPGNELPSGWYVFRFKTKSESVDYVKISQIQLERGSATTSYEPYKSTTVTCNEEVELRRVGEVKDELNLLTGKLTRRIDESGNILSRETIESIDISAVDQDGNDTKLKTFNDITHVTLSSEGLIPEAELKVAVKAIEVINTAANDQSENVDAEVEELL